MAAADKLNILVVDDLPEKLLVYQAILEELGENIILARSGAEALKKVLEQDFAVILLDVNMPVMDGFETATLIRRRKRSAHTPIIFITAYADEVQAAQGYATGAVDFILSPVVPEILRSKVRVFVNLFRMQKLIEEQAAERVALAEAQAQRRVAEEAGRRFAFLAEAGRVLMSSLDLGERMQSLARLPLPYLADLSLVWVLDERGRAERAALGWIDPELGVSLWEEVREESLTEPVRAALRRVLESGESVQIELDPDRAPLLAASEAGAGLSALRLRTALLLPLLRRNQVLGALVLARGQGRPSFPIDELGVADALAYRGALALENVRLYQRVQEADRRKEDFMAMLAHELRNPLAPIRNAVQILRMCQNEPKRLEWARELIGRQVQHLVRLVDDLLDVSRITRGKIQLQPQEVELPGVIEVALESCRPLIEARRHTLSVSLPRERVLARADPARLAQILSNLLNNAAKYTEPGGRITFSLERRAEYAVFRVRDTGIGISKEAQQQLFDPFYQVERSLDRSQGGLGIGLTLVKSLTEMHGGKVEVYSGGSGQGSEFVVTLPILIEMASGMLRVPSGELAPLAEVTHRILIVDDNRDAALSLADLLLLQGHQVKAVHDGQEALAAVEEFQPEILLLDIGLPGMDGYQIARTLREEQNRLDLLLVAITGYGQEQDLQRSLAAGFDHHLVKPVDPKAVSRLFGALRKKTVEVHPPEPSVSLRIRH